MATSGSATSTPAGGPGYTYTLCDMITKWRNLLDDTKSPYLWSNYELTDYADRIQKMLAAEMPILEDRHTAAICEVALTAGDGLIELDRRVLRITRARITGETRLLALRRSQWMDAQYESWDASDADQDTPTILVTEGLGYRNAYLYPPIDTTGTLELVVYRLPLEDLDYDLHCNEPLEMERFIHYFQHGILMQAYLKQDTDTYDPKRAEQHRILWEGNDGLGGDKDRIRRAVLVATQGPENAVPMAAWS